MEQTTQNFFLEMEREYNTTPSKLFEAWTNPDKLKQWFHPSDQMTTPEAEVDLKVGGQYRVVMRGNSDCDNENMQGEYVAMGEYVEIVENEKLVFTWQWEGNAVDTPEPTLVTLYFEASEGGSRLTLKHEKFITQEISDKHHMGWTGCLETLSQNIS